MAQPTWSIYEIFSLNEGPFSACPVRIPDTLLIDHGSPVVWYTHGTTTHIVSKLPQPALSSSDNLQEAFSKVDQAAPLSLSNELLVSYHHYTYDVPYWSKPAKPSKLNLKLAQKKGIKYPFRVIPPIAISIQRDGRIRYVDNELLERILKHGKRTGFTGIVQKLVRHRHSFPVYVEYSQTGRTDQHPLWIDECGWTKTVSPSNANSIFYVPPGSISLTAHDCDQLTVFLQRIVNHLQRVGSHLLDDDCSAFLESLQFVVLLELDEEEVVAESARNNNSNAAGSTFITSSYQPYQSQPRISANDIWFLYCTQLKMQPRAIAARILPWPPTALRTILFPDHGSSRKSSLLATMMAPASRSKSRSPTPNPTTAAATAPDAKSRKKPELKLNEIPFSHGRDRDSIDAMCPNCDASVTSRKSLIPITFEQILQSRICAPIQMSDFSFGSPQVSSLFQSSSPGSRSPPVLIRQSTERLMHRTRGLFGNPLKQRQDSIVMSMHDRIPRAFRPCIPELANDLEMFTWNELIHRKDFLDRKVLLCSDCCLKIQDAYWKRFEREAKQQTSPTIYHSQQPARSPSPPPAAAPRPSTSLADRIPRKSEPTSRSQQARKQSVASTSTFIDRSRPSTSLAMYRSPSPPFARSQSRQQKQRSRSPDDLQRQLQFLTDSQQRAFTSNLYDTQGTGEQKKLRAHSQKVKQRLRETERILIGTIRPLPTIHNRHNQHI
jgi:hypothetical protein